MKSKLLTDVELRAHWSRTRESTYCVEAGTILTPSARDFLREHKIELRMAPTEKTSGTMTRTPIPIRNGKACFIDAATGAELQEKPEEMTHLHGNVLVPKTHPRIEFRGRLDSLMAQMMGVELVAQEQQETQLLEDLEELMDYTRKMLAAEVKEEPLGEMCLLGLDSAGIRHASHFIRQELGIDHPIPSYQMGRMCVALNRLRTQVREVELSAARAFTDEHNVCCRKDIIEGLNRLSSCVYLLFCRKLSGYYDRGNKH